MAERDRVFRSALSRPARRRGRGWIWINVILAAATILALATLVLEYGFLRFDPTEGYLRSAGPVPIWATHLGQYFAGAIFVFVVWVRFFTARDKRTFLADRVVELALAAAAAAIIVISLFAPDSIRTAYGTLLIKALQVYLLVQLIAVFVRLNVLFVRSVAHPFRSIVGSFAALILIGAILLSLPAASTVQRFTGPGNNFVDHLFTATSAVCVTGLIVRDTGSDYTPFGQLVILILIQLGGLGIVIFGTIFALLIGRQISLREATLVQDLYSEQGLGQVRRIVIFVVIATLVIEAIGAFSIYPMWHGAQLTIAQRVFKSIFHAVSAYCNAGFALQSDNMISYANTWPTYTVIMPLIVLGGLGFPVLMNIAQVIRARLGSPFHRTRSQDDLDRCRVVRLTLQTKIVLVTSVLLIVVGAAAILLMERPTDARRWGRKVEYEDVAVRLEGSVLRYRPLAQRVWDSVFQSVSARTAGFSTVDLTPGSVRPATLLALIVLMVIGGSPASTAGGIKTVTFVLLAASVAATLRRRPHVEMFKRTVDRMLIRRAMVLALLFFTLVWGLNMALAWTDPQMNHLELLFESASACGTVGYSTGITPHLSLAGRLCTIVGMFAGRLGPLTLLFALTRSGKTIRYEYPREGLAIG